MDPVQPDPGEFPLRTTTDGPDRTRELGRRAAALLSGGEIILLYGDLGAGKTCFVQGVCEGLGVEGQEVVSPTFTLVNTYDARLTVHHLDFYRVEPQHDLDDIGVPAILDEVWDGAAVALIEWPTVLLAELGAAPRLELLGVAGEGTDTRTWLLRGVPGAPEAWTRLWNGFAGKDTAC